MTYLILSVVPIPFQLFYHQLIFALPAHESSQVPLVDRPSTPWGPSASGWEPLLYLIPIQGLLLLFADSVSNITNCHLNSPQIEPSSVALLPGDFEAQGK